MVEEISLISREEIKPRATKKGQYQRSETEKIDEKLTKANSATNAAYNSILDNKTRKKLEYAKDVLYEIRKDILHVPIPSKRSGKEIDRLIIDIRKRLNESQKLVKICDTKSLESISSIEILLDRNAYLDPIPSYSLLVKDTKTVKQYFVNNCKCTKK